MGRWLEPRRSEEANGGTKFLPPPLQIGWSFAISTRHRIMRPSFGQSFIRQQWWTYGMDESRRRLIRVTPIVVCHHVESVEHIFFSCPLAQQVCPMQLTSFGNSLLKEVTLALRIYFFQWCSASLMNFLANDWNHSLVFGSSWKVFFYGLFDFLKNDMTCSALQWLVVKTH